MFLFDVAIQNNIYLYTFRALMMFKRVRSIITSAAVWTILAYNSNGKPLGLNLLSSRATSAMIFWAGHLLDDTLR